jgi:hypothetical protein
MPTRRKAKVRRRPYRYEHFWDLLWGPKPDDPNAPSRELLEELWESGGRSQVMGSTFDTKPGVRPWAWWQFDFPQELKDEVEENPDLIKARRGEERAMEILEYYGFARPGEREAFEREKREKEAA